MTTPFTETQKFSAIKFILGLALIVCLPFIVMGIAAVTMLGIF